MAVQDITLVTLYHFNSNIADNWEFQKFQVFRLAILSKKEHFGLKDMLMIRHGQDC